MDSWAEDNCYTHTVLNIRIVLRTPCETRASISLNYYLTCTVVYVTRLVLIYKQQTQVAEFIFQLQDFLALLTVVIVLATQSHAIITSRSK